MNILLNFYPVQSGGGQQVASNFLKILAKNDFGHNWFVFVGKGSELEKLALKSYSNCRVLSLPYNYRNRILKIDDIKLFIEKNRIEIIYSYGPILPIKNVPQVLRTVYSNLYFPEIDFWKGNSFFVKIKKKIIDKYRLKQTLKADGLVFENESMLNRALSLFSFPKEKVRYIEPSVSVFDESSTKEDLNYLTKIESFKILYLSSWYLNKNIHVLPQVAKFLKDANCNVKFVLSLSKEDKPVQTNLLSQISKHELEEYFEFIGKIEAQFVHQIIRSSDAMILLSKLECFSSNVVEAFSFKKPLIISNEKWAHAACHDAALYVNRDDPRDIASKITNLVASSSLQNLILEASEKRLESFNTPEEKVYKQVEFLEYIYKLHEKNS